MIYTVPTKYYLVRGCAEGFTKLNAFDAALLNAGVGNTNLVRLSSILPPRCERIVPINLPQGVLVPVAYASIESDRPGEVISAAVAIAYPQDEDHCGLIMKYQEAAPKDLVEEKVCRMAEEGMRFRSQAIERVESVAAEHTVENAGAAFAAVVLWK